MSSVKTLFGNDIGMKYKAFPLVKTNKLYMGGFFLNKSKQTVNTWEQTTNITGYNKSFSSSVSSSEKCYTKLFCKGLYMHI